MQLQGILQPPKPLYWTSWRDHLQQLYSITPNTVRVQTQGSKIKTCQDELFFLTFFAPTLRRFRDLCCFRISSRRPMYGTLDQQPITPPELLDCKAWTMECLYINIDFILRSENIQELKLKTTTVRLRGEIFSICKSIDAIIRCNILTPQGCIWPYICNRNRWRWKVKSTWKERG